MTNSISGVRSPGKGKSMRDIRGDLQDRANMFEQQIGIENVRFERLICNSGRNTTTSLSFSGLSSDLRISFSSSPIGNTICVPHWQPESPWQRWLKSR